MEKKPSLVQLKTVAKFDALKWQMDNRIILYEKHLHQSLGLINELFSRQTSELPLIFAISATLFGNQKKSIIKFEVKLVYLNLILLEVLHSAFLQLLKLRLLSF